MASQAAGRNRAPGPRGLPLVGSALALQRQGQLRFYVEQWRTYGDMVRFRLGPFVAHVLAHPAHIHHVLAGNAANYDKGASYARVRPFLGLGLLTSDGELWRRQRRLMQPPFTQRSVVQYTGAIGEALEEMLTRWDVAAREGRPLAIEQEMARLAVLIIGRAMFSSDLGAMVDSLLAAGNESSAQVNRRLASIVALPLAIPTPSNRRLRRALATFDRVLYRLIEQRRREGGEREDLLGRLVAAREEGGEGMSDRQLRDELMTILFAGHETSALALTWCWYLLAQHPEVEQQLHAELESQLGGRLPTAADLPSLPYTRMVLEETMRLYPPVWTFPRGAIEADEIGGYEIPPGSLVFPSQYLTHRHPDFWEEPERFDPPRFTSERAAARERYAYYPFGGGPRTCIGVHLALLELGMVLATVVPRYRLRLLPGPPVEPRSHVTLHPSRSIPMLLEAK